ncbi:hypothetical protein TGME49_237540 [Toxoplasma gondii ME49]|uniref:Transmembrane protein n=3 Tax=Toxoplasma gondii TaxID=5811 RepID=B6KMM3_TOXGV|nr:hypothetical protein TGME49_237540 [Toxoplasma gondii ME49]EPT26587.1 hypothetical protein TGME49_237540 [Toxoplasma gondii ME49]ESS31082.1 hypothetical protein TGVEG_237540 [Toxoplasma gondii VEG]KFG35842.1 hypothetical protein TGDOM2_237540 [Toxoplasma gondii GAB2-2007-GAL-DOM2]|eukprot:XP_002369096.1 hypothetical protein TGME49_237540 [Toxoplasma gondii ME49]
MQRKNHLFLHAVEFVASVEACGSALAVCPGIHPPNYYMRIMDVSVSKVQICTKNPLERQPFVAVSLTQGACPRHGTLLVRTHAPVLCWPQVAHAGLFIYRRFSVKGHVLLRFVLCFCVCRVGRTCSTCSIGNGEQGSGARLRVKPVRQMCE